MGILLQADDVSAPAMKEALMEDFCCLPSLGWRIRARLLLQRALRVPPASHIPAKAGAAEVRV